LRRHLYLLALAIHFYFVVAIAWLDVFSLLIRGVSWFPSSLEKVWSGAGEATAAALGQSLDNSNAIRQTLTTYFHCAGIDGGYGFFAPAVPSGAKLVFELHYADGHVEYELPQVNGHAAGVRLTTLLGYIGTTDYEQLREVMIKMLAYRVWQEHPSAKTIRAVLGSISQPTASEAARGSSESYTFIGAYDFNFQPEPNASPVP